MLAKIDAEGRARHEQLMERCRLILDSLPESSAGSTLQRDALERLIWLHLKLLLARTGLQTLLREAAARAQSEDRLKAEIAALETRRGQTSEGGLARSLESQIDILRQRAARQAEAGDKLAQVVAELERVEHQVELLREETLLSAEPTTVARRIDIVSEGLNETMQWVRFEDELTASMEESLDEIPHVLAAQTRRVVR
jgi:hypothetical protein